MEQAIWELFIRYFREEKGYEKWTDEEIAGSMNQDDIRDFTEFIKIKLEV